MQNEQLRKFSLGFFILLFLIAFVRYFPIYISEGRWWADSALNGNFAYQFTKGQVLLPFFAYQLPHHIHGSQVMNILLIPFYFFSGPYYGWISFVGLLISSAILALCISLIRQEFGKNWAWAAAFAFIFFIFPPPVYVYFMRTLWANHFETTLFFVLSLLTFCWAAREQSKSYSLFILGLVLGFSCYFCYTAFSFSFALAISILYLKGRGFWKNILLFGMGFLIGFSPAILYNLTYKNVLFGTYFSQAAITAAYTEAGQLRNVGFVALYDLIFRVMPRFLFCGPGGCQPGGQPIIFVLLFGASYIYLGWQIIFKRDKSPLKVAILVTSISYLLFYAISSYAVFDYKNVFYYRYVIFLFPLMVMAIAFLLKKTNVLAPIVAIMLLVGSNQSYRYPSSFDDMKYKLKGMKGFDLVRIYGQSMPEYLQKNPSDAPRLTEKIVNGTSGFERVLALKGLGSFRLTLFRARETFIEQQIASAVGQSDRKWLAFGWGAAQAECVLESKCRMPMPTLDSAEEEKWFSVGFTLRYFWDEGDKSAYPNLGGLMDRVSTEPLAFALGFSASDYNYALPPWPPKPENMYEIIYENLGRLGGLEDPLVREKFWKGVGCETAVWFLVEYFVAREETYNRLMTPPDSLDAFSPDAESLAAGWKECLAEFGCAQSEYETKIGRFIKVVCEGEKF